MGFTAKIKVTNKGTIKICKKMYQCRRDKWNPSAIPASCRGEQEVEDAELEKKKCHYTGNFKA